MKTEPVLIKIVIGLFISIAVFTKCQLKNRVLSGNENAPHIVITPDRVFNDRRVCIHLSGFKPNQKVILKAKRGSWSSYAEFITNSFGNVDVSKLLPISGSYDTTDGMGLFWSMEPMDKKEPVFKRNLQIKTLPKGTHGARLNLCVNDVFLYLNGKSIKNREDLISRIKKQCVEVSSRNNYKNLMLQIKRDDRILNIPLKIEPCDILEKWFKEVTLETNSTAITLLEAEVNGRVVATALFEHIFKSLDIEEISVRESGLAGLLYKPKDSNKYPGVIILTGSSGGINEYAAKMLASYGYAGFALGYFAYANLPPRCREIPLEYFETAIQWMRTRKYINSNKIAVLGRSRGGELALLLGATFPEIAAVIAYVPPHIVLGSDLQGKSSWTHHGKPLNFVPNNVTDEEKSRYFNKPPFILTPMYTDRLKDTSVVKKALIPVEKINGPILLISGEDDQLIPSTFMANKVIERLREKNFRFSYEHLSYKGAGHLISQPYFPTTKKHFTTRLEFGGKIKETALASADSWEKVLQFLKKSLK